MANVDLQPLFTAPVLRQTLFPDVHPGQASNVWLVETPEESVIVRNTRMNVEPGDPFWWGGRDLFGVDPTNVPALAEINRTLKALSSIPVPSVLRTGFIDGTPYAVVERMEGMVLRSFQDLPPAALVQLGEAIARIHARSFAECGALTGTVRYPVAEFHERMVRTMRGLVERFYADQAAIAGLLDAMCQRAEQLPRPGSASLVMLDMDPTQFLTDGTRITALVDTEVYVQAPRELDLVAMEYLLDEAGSRAFATGYRQVLPLPGLSAVRPVYRYLYRLMEVQGSVDIQQWMDWPAWFDQV
jgi:aminoglycoside phosphotransferase (APT) family kinase protein